MKNSPIIFCHYGNSKYLKYVFECVKISNPDKWVILIGDESNKQVALDFGISHFNLKDYDFGEDLEVFDRVYKLITSKHFDSYKHGEDWNKFVFRKWFILNNFLIKQGIEQFWHFDSDNMIFVDLAKLEHRYQELDCTVQCSGNCMKGFFSNNKIIERYNQKINEVFMRSQFMEKVTKDIESAVHGASFNEMSVYGIFSKEEEFKSERLTKIVDNSFFDDLICVSEGMKMEKLPLGENVKLVFMNPDGRFFCQEENGNVVLVCALNLSWIPIYIYNGILKHFKKNHQKPTLEFDPNSKTLSKIPLPLKQRLKAIRKSLKKKIRSN